MRKRGEKGRRGGEMGWKGWQRNTVLSKVLVMAMN